MAALPRLATSDCFMEQLFECSQLMCGHSWCALLVWPRGRPTFITVTCDGRACNVSFGAMHVQQRAVALGLFQRCNACSAQRAAAIKFAVVSTHPWLTTTSPLEQGRHVWAGSRHSVVIFKFATASASLPIDRRTRRTAFLLICITASSGDCLQW